MACPISIGDAQQIVHWAVEIYQKIQNAEDEIKQAGVMMEELDDYLGWLRKLIEAKSASANLLDPHWNELMDRITQRMGKIKKVCQGIHSIMKLFYENLPMSKFVFPFGRNPKILRGLMEELQRHENALYRELWSANLIPVAVTVTGSGGGTGATVPSIARPLPTPSPKPTKKDSRLIFIDPHNLGRSKVAEAYSKLLGAWTTGAGKPWPVKFVHSAGMAVKSRSNCTEMLQKVKYPVTMSAGNSPPATVAMESLLDNKYYDAQFKAGLREQMMKVRSKRVTASAQTTVLMLGLHSPVPAASTPPSSKPTTTSSSSCSGSSRACSRSRRP